jgi:N-acetylmuramoyl-L-alanine amidase
MLAAWLSAVFLLTQPAPPVDVALDPGHSVADIGSASGSLREYQLTLTLALRVREKLEAAGKSVRLTREDDRPLTALTSPGETDQIRLEQEARIAAGMPARVYVSLHFNGGPATLRGTETYYNPDRDPDDWLLANALQQSVVDAIGSVDRGVRSDLLAGKPYGHFFSLRGPVASALVESLFLSNAGDRALLSEAATREALADGVAQGILGYLAMFGD